MYQLLIMDHIMEGSELLFTNDPNVARYDCSVFGAAQ